MKKQSWDKRWEKIYRSREWGKYPPEELVRFIARNYYKAPKRKNIKILDLGCGTGAATWFLAREGFSASGIDGSATAIRIAKKRFVSEKLKADLRVGDIIELPYKDETFDCVVDIASIQHNRPANMKKIVAEAHRVLKPGGRFFGMMISNGKDWHVGNYTTHFSTLQELKELFRDFRELTVDSVTRTKNNRRSSLKFWLLGAQKEYLG